MQSDRLGRTTFNFLRATLSFKGKCRFKTFLKRKPDPEGIKLHCLCDKDGYVYDSVVACNEPLKYETHLGKNVAVCYHLLKDYLEENRIVSSFTFFVLLCWIFGY